MQVYRANQPRVIRTVHVLPRRPWWIPILLLLVSVASLLCLGFGSDLVVSPTLRCNYDCMCGFGGTHCLVPGPSRFRPPAELVLGCGILATLAVFFALWLRNAKPVITAHADARSGTLSLIVRGAAHAIAFAEEPVLVSRDGQYSLHTRARPPVALGSRLSRDGLKALGALLTDGRTDRA